MIIKLRHYNLGLPTIKHLVGSFLLQIYYRSQNEFMIQAMLYYIDALESGKEVTKVPMITDKPFIKEEQDEHNKFRAEFTSKSFLNDK